MRKLGLFEVELTCMIHIQGSSSKTNTGFECDANWEAWNSRAGNKKDCDRYRKEGWCTEDGDYGETWKPRWGTFERYAEKKCYDWKANGECAIEVGRTALACPQCGCRVGKPPVFDQLREMRDIQR